MLVAAIAHSEDPHAGAAMQEILQSCEEQLNGRHPQAGFFFAALDFDHKTCIEKIHEKYPDIQLIGCTTDGEASSHRGYQEDSACLMLIASDKIEVSACVARNVSENPKMAIQQAFSSLAEERAAANKTSPLQFAIATPESMTTSADAVLKIIVEQMEKPIPVFGGTAADQWKFDKTHQFFGREILQDSVPLLFFAGDIKFSHSVKLGWTPIGKPSTTTKVDGHVLHEIDGDSALSYYQFFLGEHLRPSGEFPLAVHIGSNDPPQFCLRAPLSYDVQTGTIDFAGDIPTGATVQLTQTSRSAILDASKESVKEALEHFPGGKPDVALFFSCAARKQVLGTRTAEECEILRDVLGESTPFIGFYAYGEIGPLVSDGQSQFHNESFVTLLIGESG